MPVCRIRTAWDSLSVRWGSPDQGGTVVLKDTRPGANYLRPAGIPTVQFIRISGHPWPIHITDDAWVDNSRAHPGVYRGRPFLLFRPFPHIVPLPLSRRCPDQNELMSWHNQHLLIWSPQ